MCSSDLQRLRGLGQTVVAIRAPPGEYDCIECGGLPVPHIAQRASVGVDFSEVASLVDETSDELDGYEGRCKSRVARGGWTLCQSNSLCDFGIDRLVEEIGRNLGPFGAPPTGQLLDL